MVVLECWAWMLSLNVDLECWAWIRIWVSLVQLMACSCTHAFSVYFVCWMFHIIVVQTEPMSTMDTYALVSTFCCQVLMCLRWVVNVAGRWARVRLWMLLPLNGTFSHLTNFFMHLCVHISGWCPHWMKCCTQHRFPHAYCVFLWSLGTA